MNLHLLYVTSIQLAYSAPYREYGFTLHKTTFRDALALRYILPTRPPAVPVVLPSLLSMHCHVQKVASLPSGTMRSGTIQLIYFQKSVIMFSGTSSTTHHR